MQKTAYFCDEKNVPKGIRYPNSQLPPTNVFVHIMSVKIPVAITSPSPIANTPCWTSSTRHEKFFTSHHLPLLHFRPNPDAKDTIRNGTVPKRMGIRPDENNYNLKFQSLGQTCATTVWTGREYLKPENQANLPQFPPSQLGF